MTDRSIRFGLLVLCALALACVLTQGAWAKTYYVAPNGVDSPTGGTKAAPWKTIIYGDASSLLVPGDMVVVTEGTYVHDAAAKGTINKCSGTAAKPITYVAQGHVVIDGMGTAASSYSCILLGAGIDYIVLDGFDIAHGKRALNLTGTATNLCEGIVVKNCRMHEMHGGYAIQNANIRNCAFVNNTIYTYDTAATEGTARAFSSSTAYGNKWYNNTIRITGKVEAAPNNAGGIYFGALSTAANPAEAGTDEIKNNIIWVDQAGGRGFYTWNAAGDGAGWFGIDFIHGNNLFWPDGLRFIWTYRYPDPNFIGNWQDCSLYDANTQAQYAALNEAYGNPLFVNAAAGDFSLAAGSPAIDTGIDIGLPFFGTAPDRGAVESLPASIIAADRISDIASQPDGTAVKLNKAAVTVPGGVFKNGVFYVEDESRASGMAVKAFMPTFVEGQRVEVVGSMGTTADGQRILNAVTVKLVAGDDTPLKPVGMTGRSVFSAGIDKQGLLVTVWGKVTYNYGGVYISAYDGSGTTDGDLIGNPGTPVFIGDSVVPVDIPISPSDNKYVAVTGVIGKATCIWAPSTVIRPRSADDIRVVN